MLPSQCPFCDHVNPEDAKFCNDCGSLLHGKRCIQCDAVNDPAAKTCSKCNAEFPVKATPATSPDNVVSTGHDRGLDTPMFRLDFQIDELPDPASYVAKLTAAAQASVPREPALGTAGYTATHPARPAAAAEHDKVRPVFDPECLEDLAPSALVRSDRELTPQPESAVDTRDVRQWGPGDETDETRRSGPDLVTGGARSLDGEASSLLSASERAIAKLPLHNLEATAEPRKMSRVAQGVLLSAIASIAVGVAAYYAYSDPAQFKERQGGQVVSTSSADVNAGQPPTRPIGITAATSAPSASLSTDGVVAIATKKPAPLVQPSTAVIISRVSEGTSAATNSTGAANEAPSPDAPRRHTQPGDQATSAQHSAAKAGGVVKEPRAAIAVAQDLRQSTMPAVGNEVATKRSATNRPAPTYPAASASGSVQPTLGDGHVNLWPDEEQQQSCPEAVAALGLCNFKAREERQ